MFLSFRRKPAEKVTVDWNWQDYLHPMQISKDRDWSVLPSAPLEAGDCPPGHEYKRLLGYGVCIVKYSVGQK